MIPPPRPESAEAAALDDARVAAFLTAHPRFLAEHPDLYALLAPPVRVHGDTLADHMAALLAAARAGGTQATRDRAEAEGFFARVQAAVLALIEQPDPAVTVAEDFPRLLGLATCAIRSESLTRPDPLPPGTVEALLPAGGLTLRDVAIGSPALHGEAAPLVVREALLRLDLPQPALLVLGAREAAALPARGATAGLRFLAQALSAALLR